MGMFCLMSWPVLTRQGHTQAIATFYVILVRCYNFDDVNFVPHMVITALKSQRSLDVKGIGKYQTKVGYIVLFKAIPFFNYHMACMYQPHINYCHSGLLM